jgi:O-methyltransferase
VLREFTAFFNKQYRDAADGSFLLALQNAFLKTLRSGYSGGTLPEHVFYADDCFVVYRNLGFLKDATFQRSLVSAGVDQVMLGRVWRLWVLAWSAHSRWHTPGAFVDCGTYNGCALEVALNYSTQRLGAREGSIFACDIFDFPPEEARKVDHGPTLHELVARRLSPYGDTCVVKGELPNSLNEFDISEITWCQIDLNSAEADGATFEYLMASLADGAMVIFDDYGFSRYHATQRRVDDIVGGLNGRILELPTGQGLYVHRR